MNMMPFILAIICFFSLSRPGISVSKDGDWPPIVKESRPWTYWWWMGSAVDRENLTANLEDYSSAGLGGVHIIPIYGVRGYEEKFIPYLSEDWMRMLDHTVREAQRLGLGVDMTVGTGWPYGGPLVTAKDAAKKIIVKTFSAIGGDTFNYQPEDSSIAGIVAASLAGDRVTIYSGAQSGNPVPAWKVPPGEWKIYVALKLGTGQKVKRAAPGGEGLVLDFFSGRALSRYLGQFDRAFSGRPPGMIRAFYNDSYEVYGANWTDGLPRDFSNRYGYDFIEFLPLLIENADSDSAARVRHDYNEFISTLLRERFTGQLAEWSHKKGSRTRNQAHGSPGNLIDLYAAADIPETEAFGPSGFPIPGLRIDGNYPESSGRPDILMHKFASSAAHLAGRRLVSSESCTWLGEHFQVALSQVKPEIDALFTGGINHVFFHGIAYSPREAPYPGWLFYASTNFGQSGSFWNDLPRLTQYIARCQSFLQEGEPANDLLLYWTIHDTWRKKTDGDMLHHFQVHNVEDWFYPTDFHKAAIDLEIKGYTFDYISDNFIQSLSVHDGKLRSGGASYRALVIPGSRYMPLRTLTNLVRLAEAGARIFFIGSFPAGVPGLAGYEKESTALHRLLEQISAAPGPIRGVRKIQLGMGEIIMGEDTGTISADSLLKPEPFAGKGLRFIRRKSGAESIYFVANLGRDPVDEWMPLTADFWSAVIYDPVRGNSGIAAVGRDSDGLKSLRLSLLPGESRIIKTSGSDSLSGDPWHYYVPAGEPVYLHGTWLVRFSRGGPELPPEYTAAILESWTKRGGSAEAFHGTAEYTLKFVRPVSRNDVWILDLGKVCESARVSLNGGELETLWCFPFRISIPDTLLLKENELRIEVTNLASNRIRHLDRQKVPWKIFYDINFVDIQYRPFDASGWEIIDSGLLGPVALLPMRQVIY